VLLAGLLTLDSLFRSDLEDGSLEQLLLSPAPLAWLIAVRVLVHWLVTALPLLLATPLFAELLQLPRPLLAPLMLSLAVGTPLLSLVGAIVAALTVGIRRSGMLLAVLALPLFVPVLVFGSGAVVAASQGLPWSGAIYLLAAGLALALVLVPLAAAAALRIALS
jgi:heme exporter protein B